jgi:hypothetical protein
MTGSSKLKRHPQGRQDDRHRERDGREERRGDALTKDVDDCRVDATSRLTLYAVQPGEPPKRRAEWSLAM